MEEKEEEEGDKERGGGVVGGQGGRRRRRREEINYALILDQIMLRFIDKSSWIFRLNVVLSLNMYTDLNRSRFKY